MNRLFNLVLIIVVPFMLASCNSRIFGGKKSKQTKSPATGQSAKVPEQTAQSGVVGITPIPVTTEVPVATPGKAALISGLTPLWTKRMDYRTFTGKAKISYEGPGNSADFSANFRIAKDSLVWAHISALGGIVSVARILVTQDSFFMVNYQQKEITRLAIEDAGRILPVAVKFRQLQNLFTGEPLAEGNIVGADEKDSLWALQIEDSSFTQTVSYAKNDSTLISGSLGTRKPNGPQALSNYFRYELTGGKKVSTNRTIHIQNGVKNYLLEMEIVSPEFDKALEFPFTVPKNYTLKNY
jgi:hypothetical protein